MILPSSDGPGALAILDYAGDLTLRAPLPADLHRDAHDPEGLLAHLTHFVPSLFAITDVFVSRLATAADPCTPFHQASAPASCPSLARLLRFIAWLGPVPHFVAQATWLSHHGVPPGSNETLRQTCARCLPGLLLNDFGPCIADDVRAAVLLAHYALPVSAHQRDT
ncbi:hypothetical protein [Methylobacterium sp. Leaf469]|uniref:hypothetical protein n=1 Tax=Methylobacterium sp. Leaf469 TaxID=1736387 RepID=UPI001AEBE428|nr:hypothetical protein [Methylobacterium sp. Leaf469]